MLDFVTFVPALSVYLLTYAIEFGPELGKHVVSVLGAHGLITVSKKIITTIKSGDFQLNHDLQRAMWVSYLKAMIDLSNTSWEDAKFLLDNNALFAPSSEEVDALLELKEDFESQLTDVKHFVPPSSYPDSLLTVETVLDANDISKAKEHFQQARKQIINEILDGISCPLPDIFKRRVELDLFPRMAEFFANEIKTKEPVYRILTTQFLANNNRLTVQLIGDLHKLHLQWQATAPHVERILSKVEQLTWPDELLRIDQAFLNHHETQADPTSFYSGYTTWAAIAAGYAFPRSVNLDRSSTPYAQFKNHIEERCTPRGIHCVIITGASGDGKTVLLYQLGADLCKTRSGREDKYVVCYLTDPLEPPKVNQLYALWREAGKPLFILADVQGIEEFVYLLQRWRSALGSLAANVIFVLAMRKHEYMSYEVNTRLQTAFSTFQEAQLGKLHDEEIDSLLSLLEKHEQLHVLAGLPTAERKNRIRSANQRELIVALLEATHGKGFEQLIIEEYESIREPIRPFYALVSLLHSCRLECLRDLADQILSSHFPALRQETLNTLAPRVIIVTPSTVRTRHPLIATEILKTQIVRANKLREAERIFGFAMREVNPRSPEHRQLVASVLESLAFFKFDLEIPKKDTRRVARRFLVYDDDIRTAIWELIGAAADEMRSEKHNTMLRSFELLRWSYIYFLLEEGMQEAGASLYLKYCLRVIDLILKINPTHPRARFRRASALFTRLRAYKDLPEEESRAIWNTIDEDMEIAYLRKEGLGSSLPDFLLLYALVEEERRNPERAAALFEEALLVDPFHKIGNFQYNNFWNRRGEGQEQIISIYKAALRMEPRNTRTHLRFVDELRKRGRLDLALEETSELIQLFASNAHVWAKHASVLGDMGKRPEAIAAMRRALELHPESDFKRGQWLYNVGLWFEQSGDTVKAEEYYYESIRINDSLEYKFSWPYIALARVQLSRGSTSQVVDGLISEASKHIELGLRMSQHKESLLKAREELERLQNTSRKI